MRFYVSVGPRGLLYRVGMISTAMIGSLSYWWADRRRPAHAEPPGSPESSPVGRAPDGSILRPS
jgi:hypothetical protein